MEKTDGLPQRKREDRPLGVKIIKGRQNGYFPASGLFVDPCSFYRSFFPAYLFVVS